MGKGDSLQWLNCGARRPPKYRGQTLVLKKDDFLWNNFFFALKTDGKSFGILYARGIRESQVFEVAILCFAVICLHKMGVV